VWRYERQAGLVDGGAESVRWSVVPTPVEMSLDPHAGRTLNVQTDGWVVVVVQQAPPHLDNEARYLAGIHAGFPSSQHPQLTVGEPSTYLLDIQQTQLTLMKSHRDWHACRREKNTNENKIK